MNNIQNNIQPRLQYNYASIDTSTFECIGCGTFSYQINHPAYIEVPTATDDYIGKYYNPSDGLFYYEPEYINVFNPFA